MAVVEGQGWAALYGGYCALIGLGVVVRRDFVLRGNIMRQLNA